MFARINVASVTAGVVRVALLALALTAATMPADAQQPSPAAQKMAREIIDLKNTSMLFSPMIPGVIERVKGMLSQTNPAARKDLDTVATSLNKVFAPRVNDLLNEVAGLYASRFTEAELKEILAFYRTATGKKVIAVEPQIFDDAIAGLAGWQEKFAEEVISRFRAEMKKRGHDL